MKRLHYCLIIAVLGLALISTVHAQVIPPSPGAGALARFASVPVNLYTGATNIQAPLLTLPGRNISIPVGLSYHASGIKLQDVSGPVGLGFALNAGGVITRMVKKMPDDSRFGYSSTVIGPTGKENTSGKYLNQENAFNYTREQLYSFSAPREDVEPDIFYFNFMGRTGRFVLKANGEPMLMPYQDIKIEFDRDEEQKLLTWRITTEDGYIYTFGQEALAREETEAAQNPDGNYQTITYTSSWYLSEIQDPNNNETVSFSYQSGGDVSVVYYNELYHNNVATCGDPSDKETFNRNIRVTTKPSKRIATIKTAQGKVTFEYQYEREDLDGQALTDVKMFDNQSTLIAHYALNYGYFTGIANNGESRLKLKDIVKKSPTNDIVQYQFEYNKQEQLPPRSSIRYDHWGYYNGNPVLPEYDPNLIRAPAVTIDGETFKGLSRASAPHRSQAYILNKITQATGGYTAFEYQDHAANGKRVGGVRIYKIRHHDGSNTNPEIIKTYNYHSSGITTNTPQYGYMLLVTEDECERTLVRHAQSLVNLFDLNGTHIGYSKVTESLSDGSAATYRFTNFDNYSDIPTKIIRRNTGSTNGNVEYDTSPYPPATSKSWQRGLPREILYSDDLGDPVKKITFLYKTDTEVKEIIKGLTIWKVYDPIDLSDPRYWYEIGQYELISQAVFLESKTEELYDQNDIDWSVDRLTDYEYNLNYLQVKKETTTDSEGTEWTTEYHYPTDYYFLLPFAYGTSTKLKPEVMGIANMLARNQHSAVLEKTVKRRLVGQNEAQVVSGELNVFSSTDKEKPVRLVEQKAIEIHTPVADFKPLTFTNDNDGSQPIRASYDIRYQTQQTFNEYDNKGNLLQQTGRDQIPASQLYSYENSLLIAQIIGAGHNQLAHTSFEAPDEATFSIGFFKDRDGNFEWKNGDASFHSDAHTGQRSYSGNEIVCKDLPAGRYLISCWAKQREGNSNLTVYFSNPSTAQEAGTDWTYLEWTFNTENGISELPIFSNGNLIDEVRIHPVGAQMTTYTYDPLIGVTSETDANNITTYYEYDNHNRLQLLKDQRKDIRQRYQYVYKNQ